MSHPLPPQAKEVIPQQRDEIAHFFDGWLRASITPDLLISSTQYPEKDKERLRPLLSSYKQRHKPFEGETDLSRHRARRLSYCRCDEMSNSAKSACPSNGSRNQVGILDPSYCSGDVTLIGIAARILSDWAST